MKPLGIIVLVVLMVLGGVLIINHSKISKASPELEAFAQCLSDKGAVMYGADWCPHCQNQKNIFGGTFQKVNYVECPDEPKKCLQAGISGYPTWIFSDGVRLEGEQSFEELSKASGCKLNSAAQ